MDDVGGGRRRRSARTGAARNRATRPGTQGDRRKAAAELVSHLSAARNARGLWAAAAWWFAPRSARPPGGLWHLFCLPGAAFCAPSRAALCNAWPGFLLVVN